MAAAYVASGGYRWNAGMFVVRPTVLLDLLAEGDPAFAAALRAIAADPATLDERLAERCPGSRWTTRWPSPPPPRGGSPWCRAASAGTTSATSRRCAALLGGRRRRPRVLGDARPGAGRSTAPGWSCPAGDRVVAVVGLDDVVVVDTADALLVTTRARAQDVKAIVAALKEDGHVGLT